MEAETVRVDLGWRPYPHQEHAHALRLANRRTVLVWHRRAGKTDFALIELLFAALLFKLERGHFVYIAPLLKQAKAVVWDRLKALARQVPNTVIAEADLAITLPNKARIRLY